MPRRHTVTQGETLDKIAARYGFADGNKLHEHPDNEDLRERRSNPNLLAPGDVVTIPEPELKDVSAAVDEAHRFRLSRPRHTLRLELQDEAGQPLDGWLYTMTAGTQTYEGTIDGVLEHALPASVEEARLEVRQSDDDTARRLAWDLEIGHLDPIDTVTGAQARLNNLGYGCGEVDGDAAERTEASVKSFQEAHDLGVDGVLSPELCAKLEEVHGC